MSDKRTKVELRAAVRELVERGGTVDELAGLYVALLDAPAGEPVPAPPLLFEEVPAPMPVPVFAPRPGPHGGGLKFF